MRLKILAYSLWPLFVLVQVPWLRANGMALFPFVLVRQGPVSSRLLTHERIHLRQQLELLLVPFYLWYLIEYLYHRARGLGHYDAYMAICFEREAYRYEGDPNYLTHRKWGAFLEK